MSALLSTERIRSRAKFSFTIILILAFLGAISQNKNFEFSDAPDLPSFEGQREQIGLAGAYLGMDNGVLIFAGGSNFPDKMPWEGGKKIFYKNILLLEKDGNGNFQWKISSSKLPVSAGYGGAVSTPRGLLCFGGNDSDSCISESWFLKYEPENGDIEITSGPGLPYPLASFAFAKVDNEVYMAGGISEPAGETKSSFLVLNLNDKPEKWKWEILKPWEGDSRAFSVGVAQSNGIENCFYLFSGRRIDSSGDIKVLYDAYMYIPSSHTWQVISDGDNQKFPFMAGVAFPYGANSIVFTSGANGIQLNREIFLRKKKELLQAVSKRGMNENNAVDSIETELLKHLRNHRGFGNEVFNFNTITHSLYSLGNLPNTGQVTTNAVVWGKDIITPSGEIKPGVRTPGVLVVQVKNESRQLKAVDYLVIALYFAILSFLGYFFSKRQKNIDDYFKGGGRIPWWAAGLSIFGTALSAITFMAIPAKTFATDWSYFMLNMTILFVAPLIVYWFIPYFRKLNITTAYEFLEMRFNLTIRLLGSLSFILFQIGRMGVVMFLPSIAINVVTGMDIFLCIALMGVVSMIYTIYGGIEAVIWTDVIQVIVLLGGAVLSLVLMINSVNGGFEGIIETAKNADKINIFNLDWSLRQPTLWVMLLGGVFSSIITYGADQTMVQRYLTTKTEKEAGKSVWTNALLTVPATLIFFFLGTALFVFFKENPDRLNVSLSNADAIFPWYIVSQLPQGVSGLLIAAIFAAAMSSLSSSMNSAATSYATDIHFRFKWSNKSGQLTLARKATFFLSIAGILFAFIMATMDIKSLWDEFQKVLGLIIGSLGGVFLLGIFTEKANSNGVLIGIAGSVFTQILVITYKPIHLLVYSASGVISCFVIGYLASLFIKTKSVSKEIKFM